MEEAMIPEEKKVVMWTPKGKKRKPRPPPVPPENPDV
jgi:hypothetical protein